MVKGEIVKKAVVLFVIGILVIAVLLAYWYYLHSYKPALARKQLVEKFSKIKTWYLKLKTKGYNVTEVEYWVVKAKQAFDRGDYEEANKLLDKALKALEKAEKYSLPIFLVVKSNSWITDPVTLYDFVPFGVALIKLPDNRLTISRGEGWTASNFVQFGMCTDGENILVFHSSVNIGERSLRLMFNGKRIFRKLSGFSYYDESGKYFSYPVFSLYMGPWRKNETKIFLWKEICWVNVFGEENCGFSVYDSLAPEFQTYEIIRELAQKRGGEQRE